VVARAAVVHVGHEVEAVVDDAVAVVVEAVADLDAAVGLGALAAVRRILVSVEEAGLTGELAHPRHARRRRVGDDALMEAGAAVRGVGLQLGRIRVAKADASRAGPPGGAGAAADAARSAVPPDRPAESEAEVRVADGPVGAALRIRYPGITLGDGPEGIKVVVAACRRG
jgi:hypothetical protein